MTAEKVRVWQSAIEADRLFPIFDDRSIESCVNEIGERFAADAPGAGFPGQFKMVVPNWPTSCILDGLGGVIKAPQLRRTHKTDSPRSRAFGARAFPETRTVSNALETVTGG